MNAMKRKRSPERPLSGQPKKLSEADVEEIVNRKVSIAMSKQEDTLKVLQQKIKEMDSPNFEDKIHQLKAHIQKVKRRGDAAMIYIRNLKAQGRILPVDQQSDVLLLSTTPPAENTAPGAVTSSRNSVSGDGSIDGVSSSENDIEDLGSAHSRRKAVGGFWQGWRGRMQVVDLTAEDILANSAEPSCSVTTSTPPRASNPIVPKAEMKSPSAPAEKSSDAPPQSVPTAQPAPDRGQTSPQSSVKAVKDEPKSPNPVSMQIKTEDIPYGISESSESAAEQQEATSTARVTTTPPVPASTPAQDNTADGKAAMKGAKDPKTKKILVRDASGQGNTWIQKLHPLPDRPFPSTVPAAAASKNIPQKLTLSVVRMTDSASPAICLMWQVAEVDPHGPEMDSYYIYGAQENLDDTFSRWTQIGHIMATALPMACRLSDYISHRRLCFVMVGKDKYGRYGPYSEVECIYARSARAS
ncbi:activating transcription factor 7-interacting protein 1 [Clupea harengus]|uniref:Activating transcription factor 7-interacting protein 1 n=1 Tax=Clupea harengus TaxID=7950 RepID=A0A6P8FDR0_CLUHA|nr:activating transcription factor 7-interacting protein 1 [Clupea harengus]